MFERQRPEDLVLEIIRQVNRGLVRLSQTLLLVFFLYYLCYTSSMIHIFAAKNTEHHFYACIST